jgi:plasmid stabilization system protein ParE
MIFGISSPQNAVASKSPAGFLLLARNPYLGRRCDNDLALAYGVFLCEHVIVYRVENHDVLILRVAHGHRDMDAWFGV